MREKIKLISGQSKKKFCFIFFIVFLFFNVLFALVRESNYGLRTLTPEEKQALYNLRQERWEANSRNILKRLSSFRGEAGIVVKDLQTGWTFLHNEDQLFPAASLIKIPIMVACFKAAQEGRLDLKEKYVLKRKDRVGGSGILRRMRSGRVFTYEQLIDYMVTHSDNIATNVLIARLGFDYINSVFKQLGLEKTVLNRKMIDFSARDQGLENYTTAAEITQLLEKNLLSSVPESGNIGEMSGNLKEAENKRPLAPLSAQRCHCGSQDRSGKRGLSRCRYCFQPLRRLYNNRACPHLDWSKHR